MITVVFDEKNEYARAAGLWQWDYGQVLRIQGLTLPTAVEIHFSLAETGGQAITRVGVTRDGVTEVVIPDSMLENGPAAGSQYTIYAWLYLTDSTSGQTIRRISLQVRTRSKPEPFDTPEAEELFRRAIDTVNEAVKKAEDIGTGAETAAGEAKTAASEAGKSLEAVQRLADQVQLDADAAAQDKIAVEKIAAQAQESAFMAGLSEQSARASEMAAKQAQAGAEAAEDASRQHAEAAEEDRMEVSEARKAVEQAAVNIVADRELIRQNAKDLADVKNELTEKADVIVESANGNGYCMPDSADEPLRSLRILGKSTQNGDPTPTTPVPIVNVGDKGTILVNVAGKNLCEEETRTGTNIYTKPIALKAGTTYTLSSNKGNTNLYFNNSQTSENLLKAYGVNSLSYTPDKDVMAVGMTFREQGIRDGEKLQLELGSAATGYEHYKTPQNLAVQTPNGLLGIPVRSGGNYTDHDGRQWVTDEVDLTKGVYIKRIEKIDLKARSFIISKRISSGPFFYSRIQKPSLFKTSITGTISNIGTCRNPYSDIGDYVWVLTNGAVSEIRIGFADDAIDSVEKLTALLNSLPEAYAMYCLAEPAESPIPPEDIAAFRKLCMNYPVTTITNSDNCGMEVVYTADTKAYIDGKIAEISAAIASK